MLTKQEIRQEVREKKKQMTQNEIEGKSRQIFEKLESLPVWKEHEWVFTYVSYNQEVCTSKRIWDWIRQGKKVAVPKVVGQELSFFQLKEEKQLQSGYQGILEPAYGRCVDGHKGLLLLPGLAFDTQLNRLGYGGGFYDRYLKKWEETHMSLVSLAFDFQIYEALPVEKHDWPVACVITETKMLHA